MIALPIDVDFLIALHQLRLLVDMIHELLVVALVVVVDNVVEVGLVLDLYLLAVVFQQGGNNFAVGVVVPGFAVVLELNIISLGLAIFAVDNDTVLHAEGATRHLVGIAAAESFVIVGQGTNGGKALLIEPVQHVEIKLTLQETR